MGRILTNNEVQYNNCQRAYNMRLTFIGSGPACALAREKIAPDKIVLVIPFDSLANN